MTPRVTQMTLAMAALACSYQISLAGDVEVWPQVQALSQDSSRDGASAAVAALQAAKGQSVARLVAVSCNRELPVWTRLAATAMLGELRAAEAVDPLMAQLTTLSPDVIDERALETVYPCFPALVQIGKPASLAAVKQLRHEEDALRRAILCHIIRGVEGETLARLLVELERDREQDEVARRNLQTALDTFLRPDDGTDRK